MTSLMKGGIVLQPQASVFALVTIGSSWGEEALCCSVAGRLEGSPPPIVPKGLRYQILNPCVEWPSCLRGREPCGARHSPPRAPSCKQLQATLHQAPPPWTWVSEGSQAGNCSRRRTPAAHPLSPTSPGPRERKGPPLNEQECG